jgi:hypothetical protein
VNSHLRGFIGVVFCLALVGTPGCSQDNESDVKALNKGLGDPGPRNANEKKGEIGNDQASRAERQKRSLQDQKKGMMGPNYPKN